MYWSKFKIVWRRKNIYKRCIPKSNQIKNEQKVRLSLTSLKLDRNWNWQSYRKYECYITSFKIELFSLLTCDVTALVPWGVFIGTWSLSPRSFVSKCIQSWLLMWLNVFVDVVPFFLMHFLPVLGLMITTNWSAFAWKQTLLTPLLWVQVQTAIR